MTFVDSVIAYCSANQITEADFEVRCNLGKGSITKWKKRIHKNPSVNTLMKVERATGISVSRWLDEGGIYGQKTG